MLTKLQHFPFIRCKPERAKPLIAERRLGNRIISMRAIWQPVLSRC